MGDGRGNDVSNGLLFEAPTWRPEADRFRDEVRRALAEDVAPLVDDAERQRRFPREVIKHLADRGFIERRWANPGPYGDLSVAQVLSWELGRLISAGLGLGTSVHMEFCSGILRATPVKNRFVEGLLADALAGRKLLSISFSEPVSGSDPALLQTRATKQPDGSWVLQGHKKFMSQSVSVDYALVLARTESEGSEPALTTFAVPQGEGGFTIVRQLDKHGTHSVETWEMDLTDVRVPPDRVVSPPGGGLELELYGLTLEQLWICSLMVGSLEACLEIAQAYLRRRRGRLGSLWDYQTIRHRFADVLVEHRVLRTMVTATAVALQSGQGSQQDAAILKLAVGERLERCFSNLMELFGGHGYLDDLPIGRALRDCSLLRIVAFPEGALREVVAEIELPEDRFNSLMSFDSNGAPRTS